MKKKALLIVLVLIAVFNSTAQIIKKPNDKLKSTTNPKLSNVDRKNYILIVDSKKIKLFDSVGYYRNGPGKKVLHFAAIPLELKNNSVDTLKYLSMTCSWNDIYLSDNTTIHNEMKMCFHNFPTSESIAPHRSNTVWVRFFISQRRIKPVKFRIGMILRKVFDYKTYNFSIQNRYSAYYTARKDKQDVIWSNLVTIPAK